MSNIRTGKVSGVNGNMVAVDFEDRVIQNEVAYVVSGKEKLKAECLVALNEIKLLKNTENRT